MGILIYNPRAGRLRREPGLAAEAAAALARRVPGLEIIETSAPGHAIELAARAVRQGARRIYVMGGDGTVNEALNGMIGSQTELATLPAGTANVLACETGIPRDPVRAAAAVAALVPVRIAAGLIRCQGAEPRHFALMVGAGLDAQILDRVSAADKKRWGKLAYWVAGLAMVGRRLLPVAVEAGGRRLEAGFVLASRVRNYGGDLSIATGASLLSADFEVVAFRGRTTWPYGLYLAGALLGTASRLPGVEVMRAARIELTPVDGPVGIQVDGERLGELPASIEIVPDAVTLLVPPGFAVERPGVATGRR